MRGESLAYRLLNFVGKLGIRLVAFTQYDEGLDNLSTQLIRLADYSGL